MKLNMPKALAVLALTVTAFGASGCVVAPVGPPVSVGVGVYPTYGYARPYYGGGYYGRPAYYGPRGGGYYGRRW